MSCISCHNRQDDHEGRRIMGTVVTGSGTADDPWILSTPPGKSEFEGWRDEKSDPPALVVQVGTTQLRYLLRCIDDLHTMLHEHGDWMPLGNADEQKEAKEGTVEAWARPRSSTAPATTECAPSEEPGRASRWETRWPDAGQDRSGPRRYAGK